MDDLDWWVVPLAMWSGMVAFAFLCDFIRVLANWFRENND